MFKKALIILNLLIALALIFVHFTASIDPMEFWYFGFFGLGYPLLLIATIVFLFIWLSSKNKHLVWLSFAAILITWKSNIATFQVSTQAETVKEVSVMSWNVKNFDLYNWSGNENSREEMFSVIEENRPNILCLQEFYSEDKGKLSNLKDLKKNLDYKYYYFAKTYSLENNRHWGLVIFSDFKILDTGKLTFVEGTRLNSCMYVDVKLDENQKSRIYNVHLQSNQFSEEDYHFLENFGENEASDKQSLTNILSKMKKGYVNRAKQSKQVLESKIDSPYPSIICGDFNDTPVSFAYKTLSKNMKDAYIEKGFGFGKTFDNPSPFLRIDYALFHPLFQINSYDKIDKNLSDHYPVLVHFTY